jgi:hypothetical protein
VSDPRKPTLESVEAEGRRLGEAVGRALAGAASSGAPLPGQTADSPNLTDARRARHRSGARHNEAERAATYERTDRLSLRLRPGYAARLRTLSEGDGYSVAEWVETWIEMAEREARASPMIQIKHRHTGAAL